MCYKIFENIAAKLHAQKKLPNWLRNICITKKCVFNKLNKITHYHNNRFEEDIYFANQLLYNNIDRAKLAQQLFNLSEEIYRLI